MEGKGFQVWLSAARGLTRAHRREALAVLSGRSEGEASKAAIELGVEEARRCPHCASEGAVSRGIATRYLDNYLSWFHLVGLAPGANDRACFAAAVTR